MMVRSLDVADLERFMEGLYSLPDASVRDALRDYAEIQGIAI